MGLDAVRERFSVPEGIYLLSHSVGCLPADSEAELGRALFAPRRQRGGEAWESWLGEIERFRRAVGGLLGSESQHICPQANLSSAFTKIVHALAPDAARRAILLCEEDFPSLGFVADAARRGGFEPRYLPRGPAVQDPETWDRALRGDVRLALVTHAFSNRSALLPVSEITAVAASRGIVTVVDVAQTAGAVPLDVSAWDADFVIGSCVKFVCGGPGAGYMWVAPRALAETRPVDVGWFSHAQPFEFDIRRFAYATDALRFWGGTPSVAPFILARHAIEILRAIGIDGIHRHNQALISRLLQGVLREQIASEATPGRRGNAVLLRVAHEAHARDAMRAAGIAVDFRDGCVRLAPHLYNAEAEIDSFLQVYLTCQQR